MIKPAVWRADQHDTRYQYCHLHGQVGFAEHRPEHGSDEEQPDRYSAVPIESTSCVYCCLHRRSTVDRA